MTAVQPIPVPVMAGSPGAPGAEAALVVRWAISPGAVRASTLPALVALNGQLERLSAASLEWRVHRAEVGEGGEGAAAWAVLRLAVGDEDLSIALVEGARGRWIEAGPEGVEQAEFGPLLAVAVRRGRLLYARTALLGEVMGLRGGVYDAPACASAPGR